MGGKGYKEQERGQEAFVSLWCKLGIAWRVFFASQPARAREVAGSQGEFGPAGRLLRICVLALAWQKQSERRPEAVGTPTGEAAHRCAVG